LLYNCEDLELEQTIIDNYCYKFNMDNKMLINKRWFIDSHQGNIKDIYHFLERLGSGGFGVVYLAEHRKTGKK
jgi:serine/threonine protein kinase